MAESGPNRTDALEDVAFLARSENRVRILDALATRAYPRRELGEETGTSRTTLGRILGEFEERGWAKRATDGSYVATPRGEHVAAEFGPLVDSLEAVHALGEAVSWLPAEELTIGLRHFRDARVNRPEANEPLQPGWDLAERLREATSFRTLTYLSPPQVVGEALEKGVESGRLSVELVLAGGLVDYLHGRPEGPPPWRDFVESGARLYDYDGHVPCNVYLVDETVMLFDDQPASGEYIESGNETVRGWAVELLERYRDDAEPVEPDVFE